MSRIFAYCRASTEERTAENEVGEIAAGLPLIASALVEETTSGASVVGQRHKFGAPLDRLEATDVLIVTKLDRLGRDAIEVVLTVNRLAETGVPSALPPTCWHRSHQRRRRDDRECLGGRCSIRTRGAAH
jgi:putative DNA-invertase from lambdoid prophage Rac